MLEISEMFGQAFLNKYLNSLIGVAHHSNEQVDENDDSDEKVC